jgi:GMP synthase-like glutamine amidotransferase
VVLIIKHIDFEGPGKIEDYFRDAARAVSLIDLSKGEYLTKDIKGVEAVVSLGGPMNVYEEGIFPFLKEENFFIKEALKKEIPFLGICLGAQLLAKACGAEVKKSPQKEVGWYKIKLTGAGVKDPFFKNLGAKLDVFQWHEDMFEVPENGLLLASSEGCPYQAFRVSKNAYGLQFHVEVTPEIVNSWIEAYAKDNSQDAKFAEIRSEFLKRRPAYELQARQLCANFLEI